MMREGDRPVSCCAELGLTDPGKLLLFFYAAEPLNRTIDARNVDTLVCLLDSEGVLPVGYNFYHLPEPMSFDLHNDLDELTEQGMIFTSSPISITQEGKRAVENELAGHDKFSDAVEAIQQTLEAYENWDAQSLLEAAYVRL